VAIITQYVRIETIHAQEHEINITYDEKHINRIRTNGVPLVVHQDISQDQELAVQLQGPAIGKNRHYLSEFHE
jgi:hypothetical protein